MKTQKYTKSVGKVFLILGLILFNGCNEDKDILDDPYAGGMEPLGIRFLNEEPDPTSGPPGTEVSFRVEGLGERDGQFDFYINDELTQVLQVTDSTIRVKVPQYVSSGPASIIMDQQVFFGPRFKVEGSVKVDQNYGLAVGTDGPVYDYVAHNNGYFIVGAFTDIENMDEWWRSFNGMAQVSDQGVVDEEFNREMKDEGVGAFSTIYSTDQLSDGKLVISGNFRSYNSIDGVNNIAILNEDGSLDTKIVNVLNLTPEISENGEKEVPVFNAGAPEQVVRKVFVTKEDHIIAVGDLSAYAKIDYPRSTFRSFQYDYEPINSIMKLDRDGNLDESYHADKAGANSSITDAVLLDDDTIIIVGSFTTFDGQNVGRIVKLDKHGSVDQSFSVGVGSNGDINSIEYNANRQRLVVTGNFTSFNNQDARGIAVLNLDGTFDDQFNLGTLGGGRITFADILDDGKVVLSGTFNKYNEITRDGFLLLDPTGEVQQNFNVAGGFQGQIYDVIETTSSLGNKALILIGYLVRFDDQRIGNIIKIEILD